MPEGVVKSFDRRGGSGLLRPDGDGPDVFVHVSEVERAGLPSLEAGERIAFDIRTDIRGARSFAVHLRLL